MNKQQKKIYFVSIEVELQRVTFDHVQYHGNRIVIFVHL